MSRSATSSAATKTSAATLTAHTAAGERCPCGTRWSGGRPRRLGALVRGRATDLAAARRDEPGRRAWRRRHVAR